LPTARVEPIGSGADSSTSVIGPKISDRSGLAKSIVVPGGSSVVTASDIAVAFGPLNHGKRGLS
jgi:hypothetical protein